jgi:hypothetical protein
MLKTVFTLGLVVLLFSISFAQEKVVFKANTEFPVQLDTAINTEKNNVGDDVSFVLTEDIIGEGTKIEKGSLVYGRIVSLDKISAKNETAKVCIMFDFVKNGSDFLSLVAVITVINPNPEAVKLTASNTFSGGTVLSLKGKEIQMDKGKIFRIKLIKDITANKTA